MHNLLHTQSIYSASRIALFQRIGQKGSKKIRSFLETENCLSIPLELFQDLITIEFLYQNYFVRKQLYRRSIQIISEKLLISQGYLIDRIKKKLCMLTLDDIIIHMQYKQQFEFQLISLTRKYMLKTLTKQKIISKQISEKEKSIIEKIQRAVMKYDHTILKEQLNWTCEQEEQLKSTKFKQLFHKRSITVVLKKAKMMQISQRRQILKEWMEYDDGSSQYVIQ